MELQSQDCRHTEKGLQLQDKILLMLVMKIMPDVK